MATNKTETAVTPCHLVAMPYPGRGHINPMMNLCRLISSRIHHHRLLITFVVTEEWLCFIGSYDKPTNLRLATIPNVLPSELVRAADMSGFLEAAQTKMEEPFEQLLNRLEPWPVKLIIADTFLQWMGDVGNRRNIPVASLWTMPASVFSIFYHFEPLDHNHHFPADLSERGEERVDYILGVSSIRLADLPTIYTKDQQLLQPTLRAFSNLPKVQYILFTSFLELESQVVNALKPKFSVPLYCLGPVIPYMDLAGNASCTSTDNDHNYMKWLDFQPQNSVLYISLGSFLSISSAQMNEIAAGLRDSGVRYLWVARGDASRLKDGCGSMGMVVPWCDQLKVLCHNSVGGFWTHCGWNSTMEGIFAGVPMLTLSILMDQVPTSKFVVEDWRIGWDVKREIGGEILLREEISRLVQRFMDLESTERKELMRRARELQKICQQAITKGGSSETNLYSFINDIAIS